MRIVCAQSFKYSMYRITDTQLYWAHRTAKYMLKINTLNHICGTPEKKAMKKKRFAALYEVFFNGESNRTPTYVVYVYDVVLCCIWEDDDDVRIQIGSLGVLSAWIPHYNLQKMLMKRVLAFIFVEEEEKTKRTRVMEYAFASIILY